MGPCVAGLGAKRLWRVFKILCHLFKMAVSEISQKKNKRGEGRCFFFFFFFCKAGISLDLVNVLLFSLTSIAAYGVNPHIKSVSAGTGQDRPRPRFPAEEKQK